MRFGIFEEIGSEQYTPADIAAMTNEELAAAIRETNDWDAHLLEDLVYRAFCDEEHMQEVGDSVCFKAAEALGVEII